MENEHTISFRRRHLPHWMVADRSYFVTMRLKGSIPKRVALELQRERDDLLSHCDDPAELNELCWIQFQKIEAILDVSASGPSYLRDSSVAKIVWDAFLWLETNKHWRVYAFTIMPNHVHVLLRSLDGCSDKLSDHLGILKGFTAGQANRILGRRGAFWMGENYDHWCRSNREWQGVVRYIRDNPVKAGLVKNADDWPWTYVNIPEEEKNGPL